MMDASAKRDQIVAERVAATGIDEAMIARLVHHFYGTVRADPVLGPIFEARVADWPEHLARLCDFWSSVALMTGRFEGQPMRVHAEMPVGGAHFDRWLALFEAAAHDVCPPAAAAFFLGRAKQIAASLELGIASRRGLMLPLGERLPAPDS